MKQNNFVKINASKDEVAYAIAGMPFDECVEVILTIDQIYAETELTEAIILRLSADLKECLDESEMLTFKEKVLKALSE